jgi:hypothetical protein
MPKPRKSSTLSMRPAKTSAVPAAAEAAGIVPAVAPEVPTPTDAPTPLAKTKPQRYYYNADIEVERRLRAAYAAVSGVAGPYSSYNEFRLAGMLMLAEKLEAELNDGEPFPDAPARFAPGRPLKQV